MDAPRRVWWERPHRTLRQANGRNEEGDDAPQRPACRVPMLTPMIGTVTVAVTCDSLAAGVPTIRVELRCSSANGPG